MKNIAIFASGSGSNAENIANYFASSDYAQVTLIVANNPNAYVLERAKKLNIDFIVLAGFLLLVPQKFIDAYPGRIVNIHPALLPKYGGKGMYGDRVHEAVVAAKESESGITIHLIDGDYDKGTTFFQATCPVLPTDTPHDVAEKVHALEYKHFPETIEKILHTLD